MKYTTTEKVGTGKLSLVFKERVSQNIDVDVNVKCNELNVICLFTINFVGMTVVGSFNNICNTNAYSTYTFIQSILNISDLIRKKS